MTENNPYNIEILVGSKWQLVEDIHEDPDLGQIGFIRMGEKLIPISLEHYSQRPVEPLEPL